MTNRIDIAFTDQARRLAAEGLRSVLSRFPGLGGGGFAAGTPRSGDEWDHDDNMAGRSAIPLAERGDRDYMTDPDNLDEFMVAHAYLETLIVPTAEAGRGNFTGRGYRELADPAACVHSYKLKHYAEERYRVLKPVWKTAMAAVPGADGRMEPRRDPSTGRVVRERVGEKWCDAYVSNGMLIAAAAWLEIPFNVVSGGAIIDVVVPEELGRPELTPPNSGVMVHSFPFAQA